MVPGNKTKQNRKLSLFFNFLKGRKDTFPVIYSFLMLKPGFKGHSLWGILLGCSLLHSWPRTTEEEGTPCKWGLQGREKPLVSRSALQEPTIVLNYRPTLTSALLRKSGWRTRKTISSTMSDHAGSFDFVKRRGEDTKGTQTLRARNQTGQGQFGVLLFFLHACWNGSLFLDVYIKFGQTSAQICRNPECTYNCCPIIVPGFCNISSVNRWCSTSTKKWVQNPNLSCPQNWRQWKSTVLDVFYGDWPSLTHRNFKTRSEKTAQTVLYTKVLQRKRTP